MHFAAPVKVDVAIFGGGAAGLWLVDELRRAGYAAVVLEKDGLGQGQTIGSQGILHGGLKYSLQGLLRRSARAVRDMPQRWRQCLRGEDQPDLSDTRIRSEFCYLWRSRGLGGKLGLTAARAGLAVKPVAIKADQWPAALASVGQVYRLDEQVIDPASFLSGLFQLNRHLVLHVRDGGMDVERRGPGQVEAICVRNDSNADRLALRPRVVVLAAGRGNGPLRQALGLSEGAMQLRPLHMVVARGQLPVLNGHCIDGAHTRVTITTAEDAENRTVWQIGGQVAEDGVAMEPQEIIAHARRELSECLPAVNLDGVQWSTYRVDRAEAATKTGRRPDTETLVQEGNVLTAWPTKLVLVPALVRRILAVLREPAAGSEAAEHWANWPRPKVAAVPWEKSASWYPSR